MSRGDSRRSSMASKRRFRDLAEDALGSDGPGFSPRKLSRSPSLKVSQPRVGQSRGSGNFIDGEESKMGDSKIGGLWVLSGGGRGIGDLWVLSGGGRGSRRLDGTSFVVSLIPSPSLSLPPSLLSATQMSAEFVRFNAVSESSDAIPLWGNSNSYGPTPLSSPAGEGARRSAFDSATPVWRSWSAGVGSAGEVRAVGVGVWGS